MKRLFLFVFLIASVAALGADQEKPSLAQVRQQIGVFESLLNEHLNQSFPGPFAYLDRARGAYLPGYGVVFTCEISLTRVVAPFGALPSAAERAKGDDAPQRRALARTMSEKVLAEFGHTFDTLAAGESVAIVVQTTSATPQGLSKGTMLVRAQKRDIDQFRANTIARDEFTRRLEVLEY
jgi:hypothetical protein